MRRLPHDTSVNSRALRHIAALFGAVDRRLADVFEYGAQERLYLVRTKLPRIVDNDGRVKPHTWTQLTGPSIR
jgi:hypothetical protein